MVNYLRSNNEYERLSRYSVLRVIESDDIYLETFNQVEVPVTDQDSYHVVEEGEVNRLDIISNLYYGTPNNWWMIALANKMIDPFIVNKGTLLRIPSLITMNDSDNKILAR